MKEAPVLGERRGSILKLPVLSLTSTAFRKRVAKDVRKRQR